MMVPFLDLKAAYLELREEFDAAYLRVMESGWYILGQEVEAFEREWAAYCGTQYCVAVANGLDALHLTLRAMEVKPGDEVIVPSNTYIATWLAVSQVGAVPVPVEPDVLTHNIDPALIEAAITSRTKVILPVHLYGQPSDIEAIMEIARRYGLSVLSDAAQAHGARYKGDRCGSLAHAAAWSFYPTKNLGAFGDGGAVTTDNLDLAEKIKLLRNYGSPRKYENTLQGYNSRLDPLQAAFLRVKLPRLDEWNDRRKRVARLYLEGLRDVDGLILPAVPEWADPNWHVFVVRVARRSEFQRALADKGIQTLIHYPIPPHQSPAYTAGKLAEEIPSLPLAEMLAASVLSLPMGPHLALTDVETVIEEIRSMSHQ